MGMWLLKITHCIQLYLFMNPTVKKIIIFSFDYLFNSKLFLICFLNIFFFLKRSSNFSPQHSTVFPRHSTACLRHSIFNFFDHQMFFTPIWNATFCKNIFIFWYSYMITNFKFRTFFIILITKLEIFVWLYINRLHFNCDMISIVVFIQYII